MRYQIAQRKISVLFLQMLVLPFLAVISSGQLQAKVDKARAGQNPAARILVTANDMTSGAFLLRSVEAGKYVEAPVLGTDVKINISGLIARVRVTQYFHNPGNGWVEGRYVFPLPEESAVDMLKMQIGKRFIEGKIKPREEARQIYEKARAGGFKASLIEQQRPNIFTNEVANIGPGENITVQIEYQQAIHNDNGEFSLRFPMVVAPRYNPKPKLVIVSYDEMGMGNEGYKLLYGHDPVPDRNKITAPVLDPKTEGRINPLKAASTWI